MVNLFWNYAPMLANICMYVLMGLGLVYSMQKHGEYVRGVRRAQTMRSKNRARRKVEAA